MKITKSKCNEFLSHPSDAWKPSTFSSLAHSRVFSLSRDPLISSFSIRKIINHFFNALLSASYFSCFILLAPRQFSHDWKVFLFFSSGEGVLVSPKSDSTSLWWVPFLSSFRGWNLVFKDLPKCWCFAAEIAAMSDI